MPKNATTVQSFSTSFREQTSRATYTIMDNNKNIWRKT